MQGRRSTRINPPFSSGGLREEKRLIYLTREEGGREKEKMAKKEKKKKGEKEKRENVGCAEEIGGRGKRESRREICKEDGSS